MKYVRRDHETKREAILLCCCQGPGGRKSLYLPNTHKRTGYYFDIDKNRIERAIIRNKLKDGNGERKKER